MDPCKLTRMSFHVYFSIAVELSTLAYVVLSTTTRAGRYNAPVRRCLLLLRLPGRRRGANAKPDTDEQQHERWRRPRRLRQQRHRRHRHRFCKSHHITVQGDFFGFGCIKMPLVEFSYDQSKGVVTLLRYLTECCLKTWS